MCIAMGTYMFGCLLAGFSKSIVSLIIFRGIAGAGGGGIVSVMQIVISDVVSLRDRCAVRDSEIGRPLTNDQRKIPRHYRRRYQFWICSRSAYRWSAFSESVMACKWVDCYA